MEVVGQTFGNLVVLEEKTKHVRGGRYRFCFCECQCGSKIWIRKSSLVSGSTKSCGCLRCKSIGTKSKERIGPRVDLSGRRFGRLVVSDEWRRERSGKYYVTKWHCRCDCGAEKWVQSSSLKQSQSCGCLHREQLSQRRRLSPGEAACRSIFSQYRIRAKKKNIPFEITLDQFKGFASQPCFYCDSSESNCSITEGSNGSFGYNGIDRQDNKRGYIFDNCVSCCKICNRAKETLTIEEFVSWIERAHNCLSKSRRVYANL